MKRIIACMTLLVAGCAGAPTQEEAEEHRQAVEDILSGPMASEEYGEAQRCLPTYSYRSVEILDDRHVLFEGSGDKAWLNTLRNRCVGLRPNATLEFELRNNRVCELDTFQAVDNFFMFWQQSSGTCVLGDFQPVSQEQVEALEAAFDD